MKENGFYGEIRRKTGPDWEKILDHPFVRGIGDGTLSRERFEFYLKQDYVYLIDFARLFGLAAVKALRLEDMGVFATLLGATLNTEMELHRKTCESFGIPREELEKTRKGMVTSAYTDFLLRTGQEGDIADILAVLAPCACGYAEIAAVLKERGLPEDPFHGDWIATYTSPEYVDLCEWIIDRLNAHAEGLPPRLRERLERLYGTSTRYEYLFFDMSWRMEEWP